MPVALGNSAFLPENHDLLQVPVLEPLQPNTVYEVVEQFGQTLDVRLEFTTGTASDEISPDPVTVEGIGLERVEVPLSSCNSSTEGLRVNGRVSHPEDAVGIVVRLTSGNDVQERVLPPGPDSMRMLGSGSCDIKVTLDSDSYDVEVFARDLAGNLSASSSYRADVVGGGCSATPSAANMAWLLVAVPLIARRRRGSSSAR